MTQFKQQGRRTRVAPASFINQSQEHCTSTEWRHRVNCIIVTQRKFYRNEVYFVDVTSGLLLMRKLWRITHKLSIAQKGFMSNFWILNRRLRKENSSEILHHCRKIGKMVAICNISKPPLYLICAVYLFKDISCSLETMRQLETMKILLSARQHLMSVLLMFWFLH